MHVAILVPFRDEVRQNRSRHLAYFLETMPAILDAVSGDNTWVIIVGEQGNDGHKFMRGKLLNALATIVSNRFKTVDRFILHDVDLIPCPERARGYFAPLLPGRLLALNTTGEYAGMKNYIGGICAVSPTDFEAVNGFPNELEGWGGEDDALRDRIHPDNIDQYTLGSVQNLETDDRFMIDGQVRARDFEEFKMPKPMRHAIRQRWRSGRGPGLFETAFFVTTRTTGSFSKNCHVIGIDLNPTAPAPWEIKISKRCRQAYYWNPFTAKAQWTVDDAKLGTEKA